ncbi:DUF2303 family protein [Thiocystis violacea]|uniref:DUF2303 family protein n=1 Tax=Thiocystis violacea TaxID=13725 RepID=UPI0019054B70|nr:DUF2303 family protein [Thiocystis violacea]MBK1719189.1 hypothetical protein [Thiocystis violacea]
MIDLEQLRALILAGLNPTPDTCVLPKDYRLENTESHAREPRRLRGTYQTSSLKAWADYVTDHAGPSSRVFLDPEQFKAIARINHGTEAEPEWGDFRAVLQLRQTPAYAALESLLKAPRLQGELLDYVLDWSSDLTFFSAPGVPMTQATAVQQLQKLDTKATRAASNEETDLKRERSLLESAVITSQPPTLMVVTAAPFEDLAERDLQVRLVYAPTDPPSIRLRLLSRETLQRQWAEEFSALVCAELTSGISDISERVHLGVFTQS